MKAITSPLLEDVSIDGAQGVLMNINSGQDLTVDEVNEAASAISESARDDAQIYFGTVFDDNAGEEMRITVIATGIEDQGEDSRDTAQVENRMTLLQNKVSASDKKRETRRAPADSGEDREIPAYVRKGTGTREGSDSDKQEGKNQGQEEFIFEEDDYEIPSFIRKQAD